MNFPKSIAATILLSICFTYIYGQNVPLLQFRHSNISPTKKTSISVDSTIHKILQLTDTAEQQKQLLTYKATLIAYVGKEVDSTYSSLKKAANSFRAGTSIQQRVAHIKALQDSIRNIYKYHNVVDFINDPILKTLKSKLDTIKAYNTEEFLSPLRSSGPFLIGNLSRYSIDSLNKYFYDQKNVSAFQNAGIQNFAGGSSYVSSELASFLFGPVRLGVGGTFQTKGDSSKDAAIKSSIQKIITNGGAINLNFSLPLFFARGVNEQIHFGVFAQMNNGINPGVDSTGTSDFSKNVSFINQTGVMFHFDVGSNDSKALLTFDLPCYYELGSNNAKTQLGIPNFAAIKLQVGAKLSGLFSLYVSGPLASSSAKIQSTPYIFSIQFSPAQIANSKSN